MKLSDFWNNKISKKVKVTLIYFIILYIGYKIMGFEIGVLLGLAMILSSFDYNNN